MFLHGRHPYDRGMEKPPGHAFLSYVHEDADRVDSLQKSLESAGIRVWRDIDQLWPGEDWELRIRQAITDGAFVFVACFSNASENREKSYQRKELALAVEEFQKRKPGTPWLIPVRFEEVELPDLNLGAGRTLNSIQRIDLTSEESPNLGRLIAAVTMILARTGQQPASERRESILDDKTVDSSTQSMDSRSRLRSIIRDPQKSLVVEDLVRDALSEVRARVTDETRYPTHLENTDNVKVARFAATQVLNYVADSEPLLELIVEGCGSGSDEHRNLWTQVIRELQVDRHVGGHTILLRIRQIPQLIAMYAGAASAMTKSDYRMLKAVTVDPRVRMDDSSKAPVIGVVHPWVVFDSNDAVATVAAHLIEGKELDDKAIGEFISGRRGRRYTPAEDLMYAALRPMFDRALRDDDDYADNWVRTELLLGLIATDLKLNREDGWGYGPSIGSFTWRDRFSRDPVEDQLRREADRSDSAWAPLKAGLFGGSIDRAKAAFSAFSEAAAASRNQRF